MKKYEAKSLINKYSKGETTAEENAIVEQGFLKDLQGSDHTPSQARIEEADKRITANLMSHISVQPAEAKTIRLWPRIAAAAFILLFLSFGTYFLLQKKTSAQPFVISQANDIAPGGNKAILTLANGQKIILNSVGNGLLAQQGSSTVNKTADGQVVYAVSGSKTKNSASEIQYNSLTIPRGGEYQLVVLPDGSKVWLNSASSLRYPIAFTGNERKVELTGEAYFEVAHNPEMPFRVTSKGQAVEVLGTHFNINAYDDEPAIKTTLLEGKVKVTATISNEVRILHPGQQSALNSRLFAVAPVETEEAVAWKNGQFMFENDNIQYIMRSISRWYNVTVEYNGAIPDDSFGGGISRFKNVSEALNVLQLTGKVHFEMEGRKIIVSK
jgi:transmembrane sensor